MKKAILIATLCLPLLTGCGILEIFKKPDPPVITEKVVQVDPKLLEACKPLARLIIQQGASNVESILLDNIALNAELYAECAMKQDNSVIMLKKFGNIK